MLERSGDRFLKMGFPQQLTSKAHLLATTCEEQKRGLEDEALKLSQRRVAKGKFEVLLFSWRDISRELALQPDLMDK